MENREQVLWETPVEVGHVMLRALPTAVTTARDFVRRVLAGRCAESVLDDAVLITSELVTNGVTATGDGVAWVTVSVYARVSSVTIEVWDGSTDRPAPRRAAADETTGRGLVIVDALSVRWGCRWPATGGKTVWSEIGN